MHQYYFLATDPTPMLWYTNVIHKTATNSIYIISFLNGFANLLTNIEKETLNAGFSYGLSKILMASNEYYFWLIAYATVLLKLLIGFVQTIHSLSGYYSVNSLHPQC